MVKKCFWSSNKVSSLVARALANPKSDPNDAQSNNKHKNIQKNRFFIPASYFTWISVFAIGIVACHPKKDASENNLRILLDQPPLTLNPRIALDLNAQRIVPLLYRGLVKINADLRVEPDLAEKWQADPQGKTWKFWLKPNLKDHAGEPINAQKMRSCLEEYLHGKPFSPVGAVFTNLKTTRTDRLGALIITLNHPDSDFLNDLPSLRYFTSLGKNPCQEPHSEEHIVGSGIYRINNWSTRETNLDLVPAEKEYHPITLLFVRDDTTRAIKLLRGEADATQNGLTLTKTRWFEKNHQNSFFLFTREGTTVSYLAFNMKDPILREVRVRQAISLAIPRKEIIQYKLFGFATLAGSLLSPVLPESVQIDFPFDPTQAENLLDQAGFKKNHNGIRFQLQYKTTPVREGFETALLLKNALSKVGIELIVRVVEPAVFLASIKKGAFQLFSSRWIGVIDASLLYRTLHSREKNNRVFYQDKTMDQWLEKARSEPSPEKRNRILNKIQTKMAKDLPYFPLWYWNNALLIRKERAGNFKAEYLSLKGALEPLTLMR